MTIVGKEPAVSLHVHVYVHVYVIKRDLGRPQLDVDQTSNQLAVSMAAALRSVRWHLLELSIFGLHVMEVCLLIECITHQ